MVWTDMSLLVLLSRFAGSRSNWRSVLEDTIMFILTYNGKVKFLSNIKTTCSCKDIEIISLLYSIFIIIKSSAPLYYGIYNQGLSINNKEYFIKFLIYNIFFFTWSLLYCYWKDFDVLCLPWIFFFYFWVSIVMEKIITTYSWTSMAQTTMTWTLFVVPFI